MTANDVPLPDAVVRIERGGSEIAEAVTRADGTYGLTYPEFPRHLRAATVTVSAPGYTEDRRNFFSYSDPCLRIRENDVELVRAAGAPTDFSDLGLTILVARYELYGDNDDTTAQRFNRDLPKIVYHKILAYSSGLQVPRPGIDISVDSVSEPLAVSEGERIRRFGHEHNALGVIAGDGELIEGDDGENEYMLMSVFRTIPVYGDLAIAMQPIQDRIPARRASPSRIAGSMQDLWGKQAVLSFVLQRLVTHQGEWQHQELDELADLLIGVRDTMLADDRLHDPLEALLATIEAERS